MPKYTRILGNIHFDSFASKMYKLRLLEANFLAKDLIVC